MWYERRLFPTSINCRDMGCKKCSQLTTTNRFTTISELYAPTSTGHADNIFITKSYDATSHFETVVDDVRDVYERVTGGPLVLKKRETEIEA